MDTYKQIINSCVTPEQLIVCKDWLYTQKLEPTEFQELLLLIKEKFNLMYGD